MDADALSGGLRYYCHCCCRCCLSLELKAGPDQHSTLVPSRVPRLVQQRQRLLERTRPTTSCRRALPELQLELEKPWLLWKVPQQRRR